MWLGNHAEEVVRLFSEARKMTIMKRGRSHMRSVEGECRRIRRGCLLLIRMLLASTLGAAVGIGQSGILTLEDSE